MSIYFISCTNKVEFDSIDFNNNNNSSFSWITVSATAPLIKLGWSVIPIGLVSNSLETIISSVNIDISSIAAGMFTSGSIFEPIPITHLCFRATIFFHFDRDRIGKTQRKRFVDLYFCPDNTRIGHN